MKKVINLLGAILITGSVSAQWTYKTFNNGFDDPYKIAYVSNSENALAKLENVDNAIVFYVQDSYFCDESPVVDIVFTVNGIDKKHHLIGDKSSDNTTVFFTWNFETLPEVLADFKTASVMKVRINETHCTSEIYKFTMTNSKAAYDFMIK